VLALVVLGAGGCLRRDAELTSAQQGDAERGRALVRHYGCHTCHAIPGVAGARGKVGPPLAGVGGRLTVGGRLASTPGNLQLWIEHPQRVSPGTVMPEMGVTPRDARDITAYLLSLQ
jgi:cytochrome c2